MSIDRAGQPLSNRDKQILVGLYLSKYDGEGLRALGFTGFAEAFNVIGLALGARSASIKNYRDEFDPLFSNSRKGWHKRKVRPNCAALLASFGLLPFDLFTKLIESFFEEQRKDPDEMVADAVFRNDTFAQRLMTGLAAERYFEDIYTSLPEFSGLHAENTTRLGCGFDFKLHSRSSEHDFFAVEVKGLAQRTGTLMLTPKEHKIAGTLSDRFFLFVVKNFCEKPYHELFQNPLAGRLPFRRVERVSVQVSWNTII